MTMYDPDAPSGSGFWHWALVDIPSSVTELPTGAGAASGERLPEHAFHLPNDARLTQFIGGGPPPGDPPSSLRHCGVGTRYESIEKIGVRADSTPALVFFTVNSGGHLLARAVITPWAEVPAK